MLIIIRPENTLLLDNLVLMYFAQNPLRYARLTACARACDGSSHGQKKEMLGFRVLLLLVFTRGVGSYRCMVSGWAGSCRLTIIACKLTVNERILCFYFHVCGVFAVSVLNFSPR